MVIFESAMGLGGAGGAKKLYFFDTQYADQGPVRIGSNDISDNSQNIGKLLLL